MAHKANKFDLGPGFELDAEDAFSGTYGTVGVRGTGKSFLLMKFAEQALRYSFHNLFLDPQGIFHGLRLSADGKKPGFPVLLLGGPHNPDIDLTKDMGEKVAEFYVNGPGSSVGSMILDLSEFRKGEARTFLTAFLNEMFRLKNKERTPVMVYLDEAQLWVPQTGGRGKQETDNQLVGAMEDVVGRGRHRGLFVFLAGLRAAMINKNVLSQVETLFIMRQLAPQDRKQIREWLQDAISPEEVQKAMAAIPALQRGDVLAFSPARFPDVKHFHVGQRETYDSSFTPKTGQAKVALLGKEAKLDPELIASLRDALLPKPKQGKPLPSLKEHVAAALPPQSPPRVEILVPTHPLAPVDRDILQAHFDQLKDWIYQADGICKRIEPLLKNALAEPKGAKPAGAAGELRPTKEKPVIAVLRPQAKPAEARAVENDGLEPSGPQQKLLDAVASFERVGIPSPTKSLIAIRAGYKPDTGTVNTYFAELKKQGWVAYDGKGGASLTPAGRGHAVVDDTPVTLEGHQAAWLAMLSGPQKKFLKVVMDIYPDSIDKDELAVEAGYTPNTGTVNTYISELRKLGLITARSPIAATELIFPPGLQ